MMLNEHVIIIGMALLVYLLIWRGRLGWMAGIVSAVLIVGAMRHPELVGSKPTVGTQEETLQATMLLVGLILFPRLAWWWVRGLFRKGGR